MTVFVHGVAAQKCSVADYGRMGRTPILSPRFVSILAWLHTALRGSGSSTMDG